MGNEEDDSDELIPKARKSKKERELEQLLELFKQQHPEHDESIVPHEIADWAIDGGRWKRPPPEPNEILRRDIASYLKRRHMTDPQGRRVKENHAILIPVETQRGRRYLSRYWPLFQAPVKHMLVSLQTRRRSAVGDVVQIEKDRESYNDNNIHGEAVPQMDFNFNPDVEESKLPTDYPTTGIVDEPEEDDDEV